MSITSPLLQNDHEVNVEQDKDQDEEILDEETQANEASQRKHDIRDVTEAKAYIRIYAGKGIKVINHIFYLSALITLANEAAGCDTDDDDDDECNKTVYGLKPSSITPMLHVFSALFSVIFMPIGGALIDFTSHRRLIGICTAYGVVLISFVLIGTTEDTWFYMMMIFIIYNLLEEIQNLTIFSYLPDVGTKLNDQAMASFTSRASMCQYGLMIFFVILITGVGIKAGFGDADLSRFACGLGGIIMSCFFYSWFSMPIVPQLHRIPPGQSLLVAGFYQNWRTFKGIFNLYTYGLNLFLVASAFATPAAKMILGVCVIILKEDLNMEGTEIGIFFLSTLLFAIPGAKIASYVSNKFNPIISLQIVCVMYIVVAAIGVLIVDRPEVKGLAYIFGIFIGIMIGWFYPTTNLIFSLAIPKGQESELTGFYIYFSSILDWVPPLIFAAINESGGGKKAGMMGVLCFFVPAVIALQCMIPWEDVRLSAKDQSKMIPVYEDD